MMRVGYVDIAFPLPYLAAVKVMIVATFLTSLLIGVASAHTGPIWGHGEDYVKAKLGEDNTTAPQTCILGTQVNIRCPLSCLVLTQLYYIIEWLPNLGM